MVKKLSPSELSKLSKSERKTYDRRVQREGTIMELKDRFWTGTK